MITRSLVNGCQHFGGTLKMEEICFSETLTAFKTIWCHSLKDTQIKLQLCNTDFAKNQFSCVDYKLCKSVTATNSTYYMLQHRKLTAQTFCPRVQLFWRRLDQMFQAIIHVCCALCNSTLKVWYRCVSKLITMLTAFSHSCISSRAF